MATGTDLRHEFEQFMDAKGVKYRTVDGADNIVRVSFNSDAIGSIVVFVDFDEDDDCDTVHFCAQNFAKVKSQDVLPKALVVLNELNRGYRWLKFWVNVETLEITADADGYVYPGSVGEACTNMCFRSANIIDGALEKLDGVIEKESGENKADKEEILAQIRALMAQLDDE